MSCESDHLFLIRHNLKKILESFFNCKILNVCMPAHRFCTNCGNHITRFQFQPLKCRT